MVVVVREERDEGEGDVHLYTGEDSGEGDR